MTRTEKGKKGGRERLLKGECALQAFMIDDRPRLLREAKRLAMTRTEKGRKGRGKVSGASVTMRVAAASAAASARARQIIVEC